MNKNIVEKSYINKAVQFKDHWYWEEQKKSILRDEKTNNLMVLSAIHEATCNKKMINTSSLLKQLPLSFFEFSMSIDELDGDGYIEILNTASNKELLRVTDSGKSLLTHAFN